MPKNRISCGAKTTKTAPTSAPPASTILSPRRMVTRMLSLSRSPVKMDATVEMALPAPSKMAAGMVLMV